MADLIAKIPLNSQGKPSSSAQASSPKAPSPGEKNSTGFLELVVDQYRDFSSPKLISPAQHRAARRRVFERIVTSTLTHPQHPYSSLASTQMGRDMVSAIIEELVNSHYQTS